MPCELAAGVAHGGLLALRAARPFVERQRKQLPMLTRLAFVFTSLSMVNIVVPVVDSSVQLQTVMWNEGIRLYAAANDLRRPGMASRESVAMIRNATGCFAMPSDAAVSRDMSSSVGMLSCTTGSGQAASSSSQRPSSSTTAADSAAPTSRGKRGRTYRTDPALRCSECSTTCNGYKSWMHHLTGSLYCHERDARCTVVDPEAEAALKLSRSAGEAAFT